MKKPKRNLNKSIILVLIKKYIVNCTAFKMKRSIMLKK